MTDKEITTLKLLLVTGGKITLSQGVLNALSAGLITANEARKMLGVETPKGDQ